MPKYKFCYFDARARGEPSRVLLAAVGMPFEDQRISQEEFKPMKEKDPFLSLPILEVSNAGGKGSQETVVMNQSMAINRHLARTFGLDGETLNDKAMVDEIIENLVDLKGAMFPIFFNDNEETRKKFADTQAKMCPKLEAQIQRNMKKGGGFAVGSKMTFADIFIFEAFESILGKDASCLDKYPGIKQCREKTGKHPKIAEYVKKRKETPF